MGTQRSLSIRVVVGSSNHCSYFQKPTGNHYIFVLHRFQEKVKNIYIYFWPELHQNGGVRKCRLATIYLSSDNGNYITNIICWANVFPGLGALEWGG